MRLFTQQIYEKSKDILFMFVTGMHVYMGDLRLIWMLISQLAIFKNK